VTWQGPRDGQKRKKHRYCDQNGQQCQSALLDLSVASKFACDWDFLCMLRDHGRAETVRGLTRNREAIGERSSVNLDAEFLDSGAEQRDASRVGAV
jgi:hypothetical protein